MSDNVVRLKIDSQEYDSKISRASKGLQALGQNLRSAGKTFADADKEAVVFARELGKMQTVSTSARGKVSELSAAFVNLKSDYLQMTEAEKRSPMGQAMAKSLEELKNRTIEAKHELESLNKEINGIKTPDVGSIVGKEGGGLFSGDKISGMLQVFGGNMMTKAAGWAAGFVSEIGDAVKQGIELAKAGEGVRIAFERLNQPGLLDNLREATHGTVTNLELMKAAVKFNDFKLPLDELGTMLAFAQQKAKDTGQSVDYMVDSIVTGLGRKSLMILDNLVLSANEVKEKMKETGDMTKAVGEIIREQMSKAGDYVETAADRATQADVNLKNAMEELGRTFQPLSDAGASLWSSLKIGALDLLNSAVRPLIDALTEAGRIRSQFAKQGGDERVNRMLGRLSGISNSQYRKNTYNAQLGNFNTKIDSYQQYLTDYMKWQGDKTAVGAYDRMQSFQKQTGLSLYSDVKEQLEVFKRMRSEYVQGAKIILNDNPSPSPADTTITKPTKTPKGGGGGTTEPTYAADSITAQTKLVSDLTKKWNDASDEMRNGYLYQLIEAEKKLKEMKDEQAAIKEMKELGTVSGVSAQSITEQMFPTKSIKDLQGLKIELKLPKDKTEASLTKEVGNMAGGISQMASGLEQLGIELPEGLAQAVNGITSLISVVSGIATIVMAIEALTAADTIIPFARGGVVRAAGGYVVPGNYNSGDMVHAALTSGEVVLNRAQVGNLASQLQEGGGGGGGVQVARISGEQIYVALDRYLKRSGRGELLTWG